MEELENKGQEHGFHGAGGTDNLRQEIFSETVRAGKRTYFFDVKATRKNEYYLTVTESKKRFNREGDFFYEKHKIFLYKEDFDKFSDALVSTLGFIKDKQPNGALPEDENTETNAKEETTSDDYTNVEFEDLEEKKK